MKQLIFNIDEYKKLIAIDGFTLDDDRFVFLKSLSKLLMFAHDSILSMVMLRDSNKYESGGSHEEHIIQQSLLRNAVLNYSKCFSTSGKGEITLQEKDVFKNNKEHLLAHQKVMKLRNTFFAHNDDSGLDFMGLTTKETDSEIEVKQLYQIVLPTDDFPEFFKLFRFVGDHIKAMTEKRVTNLEQKLGKPINVFN